MNIQNGIGFWWRFGLSQDKLRVLAAEAIKNRLKKSVRWVGWGVVLWGGGRWTQRCYSRPVRDSAMPFLH